MWQEKPPIIVMVTNLKEGNKVKCQQYWPEAGASQYCTFKFDKFVYVYANSGWKRNHVLIQSAISLSVLC